MAPKNYITEVPEKDQTTGEATGNETYPAGREPVFAYGRKRIPIEEYLQRKRTMGIDRI